jgi:hypothetical protein
VSAKNSIVHENGRFWVNRAGVGHYEVLENVGCGSVCRGTYHFTDRPEYALGRAVDNCDERANGDTQHG